LAKFACKLKKMKDFEKVHMGKLVGKRLKEREKNAKTFARNIGKSEPRVYQLLNEPVIEIGLLMKMCKALNYNFFKEYLDEAELPDVEVRDQKIMELEKRIVDLENEKREMREEFYKKEIELLRRLAK